MKHHPISMQRRHLVIAGLAGIAAPASLFAGQCGGDAGNAPAVAGLVVRGTGEDRLVVSGRILGAPDCKPLADAVVEAWHEDARADRTTATTDADGRFMFMTVAPAAHPGGAPRIQYRVSHQGQVLATRELYFARELGVADDTVAHLQRDDTGVWRAAFGLMLG